MTQTGEADATAIDPRVDELAERYGRKRSRSIDRRIAWIAVIIALAVGAWVLFFGNWKEGTELEFRDLNYSVIDNRSVQIDFEISAPPGSQVVCALEALSTSFSQLGWKIIEVPVSDKRTQRLSETLVTTARATTGHAQLCWID